MDDKMEDKMKECFAPHAIYHSLFGLGLGYLLAALFPVLANIWLGVVLMVVAIALDKMRK